jgi:hypothetical protein
MLLPETAQFDSQKFRFPKFFQNLNRLWTGTKLARKLRQIAGLPGGLRCLQNKSREWK